MNLVLILVGLIVWKGCLQADFYMDDYQFIVKSDYSGRPESFIKFFGYTIGDVSVNAVEKPVSALIPHLVFRGTYDAFGPSSVVFHLWTLLAHVLLALLARVTVRKFLMVSRMLPDLVTADRIAFWAALIFLVHPLCSETVNYAKCFYMELVGISALLSCLATLCLVESLSLKHVFGLIGSLAFASISYPYSFPIAIAQSAVLFCFLSPQLGVWLAVFKRNRWLQGITLACGVYLAFVLQGMIKWYLWHLANMDYTFSSHILTQGRVFWEYAGRMVIPTDLCSDHLVAWSTHWGDAEAVVKLGFVGLLGIALVVWAWLKRRQMQGGLALAFLMVMIPLVVRWPYTSHEPMVEYRTYPCMVWVGLIFALGIFGLSQWMTTLPKARFQSPVKMMRLLGCGVVVIFSCLSMKRSRDWQTFTGLSENVVERYPLNLRALANLQYTMNLAREYQETLAIHKEMTSKLNEIKRLNSVNPLLRQYDIIQAEKAFLAGEGQCGAAIAQMDGARAGIAYVEKRLDQLSASRPDLFKPTNEAGPPRITALLNNLHALRAGIDQIEAERAAKSNIFSKLRDTP